MSKVAIMAGTPVDTRMGAELLKDFSCDLVEIAVSENPLQQTYFQTLPPAQK